MVSARSTDKERTKDSTQNSVAYRLLRILSHDRNLRTHELMSRIARQVVHDGSSARAFLQYVGEHTQLNLKDRSVIDIGCGYGDLAIVVAKAGARRVVGVDVDQDWIATARRNAAAEGVGKVAAFECSDFVDDFNPDEPFDFAFSQNGFEHILDPVCCLMRAQDCLTPGGVLATMFGPLWNSPYGAHTRSYTPVPWVHFLFPEKVVLRVRAERYRPDDPAERYEDVRGHLNRMTVKRFRRCVIRAGFRVETMRLNPPQDHGKYQPANAVINAVPLLQELGSLQLLAVLHKSD